MTTLAAKCRSLRNIVQLVAPRASHPVRHEWLHEEMPGLDATELMGKALRINLAELTFGWWQWQCRFQPVAVQPRFLGFESLAATSKRTQTRTVQRREIRKPALTIRLDVAGSADDQLTEAGKVDRLAIEAMNRSLLVNQHLHD